MNNNEKKLTKEDIELIKQFDEIEENTRKNYVPLPQRKNYIYHLIDSGYTPTLCYPNRKIPYYEKWQNTFWIEDKDVFFNECEKYNYDLNYGVLCGLAKYNNVSCIDFDVKQFTESEQDYLINQINNLLQTEYIQGLILSKKLYLEKSVNNGYHFVVSILDENERKGAKLLDYSGVCKPNNLVNEVHSGLGEFLETRGKKQHFISFPSNGYTKLYNNIWELEKVSSQEYEEFEKFIMDYFLNQSNGKFSKAKEHHLLDNSPKKRIPKSERGVTKETNKVIQELKKYQTTFANTQKDITIISKLLEENGYTLISENDEYIYYIHPNSSKAESNFSLSKLNHCVTNFSGNNQDFPLEKSVGTLTAFYILNESKHNVNEIIEILRTDYNVKLVRTYQEIINDINNNN